MNVAPGFLSFQVMSTVYIGRILFHITLYPGPLPIHNIHSRFPIVSHPFLRFNSLSWHSISFSRDYLFIWSPFVVYNFVETHFSAYMVISFLRHGKKKVIINNTILKFPDYRCSFLPVVLYAWTNSGHLPLFSAAGVTWYFSRLDEYSRRLYSPEGMQSILAGLGVTRICIFIP